ncbi:MAG: hypothetical protein DRQ97_11990 [Gammaproteobacteria bacterium]|nr:MAG: hypothetical protein DRQ97_11990 [Gammaproteobacteria bacterium]
MLTDLRTLPESARWGLDLKMHLDNVLGRVDYPHFVSEVLGYHAISHNPHDPAAFEQFRDPRVQWHLGEVGTYVKNWMNTRNEQTAFRKIMDIRPRGTVKSATATIPLPIWAHINSPEIACAVIGAKFKDIAEDFSKATRATFEGNDRHSRLVELYGQFKGGAGRDWQVAKMTTAKRQNLGRSDPTYAAFSIGKGATGGHFDLLIMDDPVTRETMEGDQEWLEKVWATYTRIPYLINRNGLFYLVMTRYHDNDLCGRIIREEIEPAVEAEYGSLPADWDYERGWIKYAHLAGWEVRYDAVYEDYDKATRTGKVVYPICWSDDKIKLSRQTDAGEAEFWFHLMNAPQEREDQPIVKKHIDACWIESLDEVPAPAMHHLDIQCDFAFKDGAAFLKQSGDWGVAHVVAKYNGHVYRIGGIRAKMKQEDFGEELMKLVAWVHYDLKARVRYITYDKGIHGSGDKTMEFWIHELFRTHSDLPRATPKPLDRRRGPRAKKVDRILSTVWAWTDGYVHLLRSAAHNDPLVYQALNIGFSSHDDDIDSFSDSFDEALYHASPVFMEGEDDWGKSWQTAVEPVDPFDDEDW